MNHLDEKTLELYVLGAKEVEPRRGDIQRHLNQCSGCSAQHEELVEYYAEVRRLGEERAKAESQALSVQAVITEFPTLSHRGPLGQRPMTLPARILFFVIKHPIVSAASFAGFMFGVFMLGVNVTGPREETIADRNPHHARARNEFLVVFNRSGQEIWNKHVGSGYDEIFLDENGLDFHKYICVKDIDGDNKNEVLVALGGNAEWDSSKFVVCFQSDGQRKWSYPVSRRMTFGIEPIEDAFFPRHLLVDDFDNDGNIEAIAIATNNPLYPNVVIKLDAKSGRFISEYWNCGTLGAPRVVDLDQDGIKEILISGANNGFHHAPLIVLDPRHISGHSPAPPDYIPVGVPKGTEKYYILLPRSDLSAFSTTGNTEGYHVQSDDLIRLNAKETIGNIHPSLIYYFDFKLNCVRIEDSNEFTVIHNQMVAEGKLRKKLDHRYWEELRQGVKYWDGEKFVSKPTSNRSYEALLPGGNP